MRDYWNMSDEEREQFFDKYYSNLQQLMSKYLDSLSDEEVKSNVTYDLINDWGKGDLVLVLMGIFKEKGVEII